MSNEMRNLLEAGDLAGLRAFWAKYAPHLPQPENDEQASVTMHVARTEAESVTLQKRIYSHLWLTERGLPSHLPNELKPKAEQVEQRIVEGVGISVNTNNPLLKPVMREVQRAMELAVEDLYADGVPDVLLTQMRMQEAKEKTFRSLMGV